MADSLSREEIQQHGQIDKTRCDADIGNIGNPNLIDGGNGTILKKIGIEGVAMIALGRPHPFPVRTTD